MPSCPLCAINFPGFSADVPCKRCVALQALDVEPNHPNYIHTQGWKQCSHCGISAPHLGTASNVPKTVCLNQACVSWVTALTEGEEHTIVAPLSISSVTEQRVLAAQARLKRFPTPSSTLSATMIKPRSVSRGSSAEKMITVAYNVCRSNCKTSDPGIGGQAVPKPRSVLMPDLLAEFLDVINVEWVKSSPEKLVLSDVSFRFFGNRLLEKGTSTMSLGEFYDHYHHPERRELWLSKAIPLWKNVKSPILHLEVNINMTAVKSRATQLDSDEEEFPSLGLKRRKKGMTSTAKRVRSSSSPLISHFSPATTGLLRGQLGVQEQCPIQLIKIQCSADLVDGEVMFTSVDGIVSGFIVKNEMARGTMKRVHQLTLSGASYVAKSFFRVEEASLDDSVNAPDNEVELKLELRRIAQGKWFLKKFYEQARHIGVTSIYQDLHFVDAYLGTEAEPTGIISQKDGSTTPTPWTWIVERRRPMSVAKWSGTLTHPNYRTDLIGATICAFVHFAYIFSRHSVVFADIQGTHAQISPGVEGLVLFDIMTHTTAGDSGIGDHGTEGIKSFISDHVCGPVCKRLKLEGLTVDQDPPTSPESSEQDSERELDGNQSEGHDD